MKKVLGSLLAIGLMATAANAATIGLRWAGNPNQNNDGPGTIEVYMSLLAGDQISGVIFNWQTADENLVLAGQTAGPAGWTQTGIGVGGALGAGQFVGAANPGFVLQGPAADVVIGTSTVNILGPADLSIKEIFAPIPQNPSGVTNELGSRLTWDARYNASFSGYIAFADWGNPGWGTKPASGHQPTPNPLLITKVPEPTSLALIALGGFALLRRR